MSDTRSRHDVILALLSEKGFATLHEMAETVQVSEATVRRDLAALEGMGVIKRTRGGAFFTGGGSQEVAFAKRETACVVEKQAIAAAAEQLIEDGETVLLDGGTSTYELAKLLVGRDLQIVTNSLPIAALFSDRLDAQLVLIGGYLYPKTGVAVGPLAVAGLQSIHANKVFLSAAGIQEDGLFNVSMAMVEVERCMLKCADSSIVLADHSKFGRRALSHLARLNEMNVFICDTGLGTEHREMLLAEIGQLIIAEVYDPRFDESRWNDDSAG